MAGGDLRNALVRDIAANGAGTNRWLGWYARGRRILVDVVRGLVFMHSQGVSLPACLDSASLRHLLEEHAGSLSVERPMLLAFTTWLIIPRRSAAFELTSLQLYLESQFMCGHVVHMGNAMTHH